MAHTTIAPTPQHSDESRRRLWIRGIGHSFLERCTEIGSRPQRSMIAKTASKTSWGAVDVVVDTVGGEPRDRSFKCVAKAAWGSPRHIERRTLFEFVIHLRRIYALCTDRGAQGVRWPSGSVSVTPIFRSYRGRSRETKTNFSGRLPSTRPA